MESGICKKLKASFSEEKLRIMGQEILNWHKTGVVAEDAELRKYANSLQEELGIPEHSALRAAEDNIKHYALVRWLKST